MKTHQQSLTRKTWKSTLVGLAIAVVAGLCTLGLATPPAYADCPNCPGPDPGEGSDPVGLQSPHFVFQFSPCLPNVLLNQFGANVQRSLAAALDAVDLKNNGTSLSPEIHTRCTASGTSVLAVWLSASNTLWQSRQDSLSTMNELAAGETVAMRFRDRAIRSLIGEARGDLPTMEPAYVGSPYLTYYGSTNGNAAIKRLVTTIPGWVDGPFSDTDFWVTITDQMRLDGTKLACSTAIALDMEDDTFDYILNEIFNFTNPESMLQGLTAKGPGCQIADAAPNQVLLPLTTTFLGGTFGLKEVFDYRRLVLSGAGSEQGGIFIGGTHRTAVRTPAVTIDGPSTVQAELTEPASGIYDARVTDLREPLTVTWSSPNATIVRSGLRADITWNMPIIGMGVQRAIHVTVTDAEGLTATFTKNVLIKRPNGAHVGN